MLMKRYLFLALIALGFLLPASAQVINCPSGFSSSGPCGVALIGGGAQSLRSSVTRMGESGLSGSRVDFIPTA